MKYNPYYNPNELALTLRSVEDEHLSWEFDILAFFATDDGRVYTASDSGFSCPTPFEDYEGEDQKAVLQLLERVESGSHAERIFKVWNKGYNSTKTKTDPSEGHSIRLWVDGMLGNIKAEPAYPEREVVDTENRVWVLTGYDEVAETTIILGVFSSKQRAEEAMKNFYASIKGRNPLLQLNSCVMNKLEWL
jgi:hypothetical protein